MAPFEATFDKFHEHTAPADWLEGLVKAYVGDGLAADFYREVAAYVDADTRELILHTLSDTGSSEFGMVAARLNLDMDLRLTSTERFHAFFRPIDKNNKFTSYTFSGKSPFNANKGAKKVNDRFFGEWLPASGRDTRAIPAFEIYRNSPLNTLCPWL